MARQSLLWTALPNGLSEDGASLRISLLVSPRLEAKNDPEELSSFPHFIDWPGTLRKSLFTVRFGAAPEVTIDGADTTGPNRVDGARGRADSRAWKAMFPQTTFVRGFGFKDLSNNQVLSYSAAKMEDFVRGLYGPLASGAGDQLPTPSTFLGNPKWQELVTTLHRLDEGFKDPRDRFKLFGETGFKNLDGLQRDLALFQLFHTPPSTALTQKYPVPASDPKSRAEWRTHARAEFPKAADFQKLIDFHQIVGAMNQYPTLLRRLGLVVDLLINKNAFVAVSDAPLEVEVKLPELPPSSGVQSAPAASARTRTLLDAKRFQPVPRLSPKPGDYRVADGLLDLNPKLFDLVQTDVDGAGLKVMNFARTLGLLQRKPATQVHPVSKQEHELGAPALRNAGLMLVHANRGGMLKNSFDRQKLFNTTVEAIHNGAGLLGPELFAEDLVRGYRVDIWDRKTKRWKSLCQREATYDLNAGEMEITVPEEEGTVRLAATKSADAASNQKLIWLHEALISWTGWSLCAPPPGRTINNKDEVADPEAEVPPGIRLATAFTVAPGSLPRLRYGREYWIRARTVDLAGNSLGAQPKDFGPENPSGKARPYLRYDPISAPALALVKPTAGTVEKPEEGESMERMAVRTFNDTPAQNTIPSTQVARRFAVPARTTQREAEQHGLLDAGGIVDPAFFGMLSAKDNSLAEEKILTGGPLAETAPVETGFAVMTDGDELPYLPDPLAGLIVARIFDLPGFSPDALIKIPLYPDAAKWPGAVPFKITLYENPADAPHFDEAARTLFVPLPKAIRATLRLSVAPTAKALSILGIWHWLTPAQQAATEARARRGQHWMLTPWSEIELVHAVQKPLITPEIGKFEIGRGLLATNAEPNFFASCSIKSTDHLDLRAAWNEPVDDASQSMGANRDRTDHAFGVKTTDEKEYAARPEYQLVGDDYVRAGGFFHDRVATKVHEFNDTRYRRIEYWLDATTKFREFMPAGILTEVVGGVSKPTDARIKVIGPKVRGWVRNSAPPPAPDVLYVVPTFGWVRTNTAQGGKSSWRRGGGLRVYLNRPWGVSGYGEMLAVVLPSPAFAADPNKQPSGQPLKNFVTQWGNDPIWSSAFVSGVAPKRANFPLARVARDPAGKWLPSFAPATEADQPPGPFLTSGLGHPELKIANPEARVAIAPHDVFYDDERQLWFSDIEINFGAAYYPFVRLALARYQPVSVSGAHLSNIVLADFMPLVSDRWLSATRTNQPRTHRVSVFGPTFQDSSSHVEAAHAPESIVRLPNGRVVRQRAAEVASTSVIEVWVERFDPALGEDFGWKREPNALVQPSGTTVRPVKAITVKARTRARKLMQERKFEVLLKDNLLANVFAIPRLWEGAVATPDSAAENTRYRLAIAEYEEYLTDDESPYNPTPTAKGRRLVFIEHVELG